MYSAKDLTFTCMDLGCAIEKTPMNPKWDGYRVCISTALKSSFKCCLDEIGSSLGPALISDLLLFLHNLW